MIGPNGQKEVLDPSTAECRLVLDYGLPQKLATIEGAGISLNSLWSVDNELGSGDLVLFLPGYELADKTVLWQVYPKSNVLLPKVRVSMDFFNRKGCESRVLGATVGYRMSESMQTRRLAKFLAPPLPAVLDKFQKERRSTNDRLGDGGPRNAVANGWAVTLARRVAYQLLRLLQSQRRSCTLADE